MNPKHRELILLVRQKHHVILGESIRIATWNQRTKFQHVEVRD